MALTGLFLVSFLLVHLIGNFQLFAGDGGEAFNKYTKFMTTSPIIRVMEIFLVLGFVAHIWIAIVLTRQNKAARPVKYAYEAPNPGVSWFSKNMGLSGSIILVFLIIHLIDFYGAYHYGSEIGTVTYGDMEYKNMFGIVKEEFQEEWWTSVVYVLAMVLLGFHLNHGFQSAFRTFGIEHKKYTPTIQGLSVLLSILIPAGFASMPLFFLLTK